MADPISAASPKAPTISASDYISKLTTVMPKSGVYGKD